MNKSDKIKAQLFELIRAHRQRIDPAVLAKAQEAAQAQLQQMQASSKATQEIPFDQVAAKDIVQRFLQLKQGDRAFIEKLKQHMATKSDEAVS